MAVVGGDPEQRCRPQFVEADGVGDVPELLNRRMRVVTPLIDRRMAIEDLKVLLKRGLGEIGRGDRVAKVRMIEVGNDFPSGRSA